MTHQQFENPYLFQLRVENKPSRALIQTYEEEVILEQRQTVFQSDPVLRRLFCGDFESYARLLDDPEQLVEKLQTWLDALIDRQAQMPWMGREERIGEEDEESLKLEAETDNEEEVDEEEREIDDPLLIQANEWAVRAHRWSHTLYYNKKIKDRDLFRVHANAFAVADLVYVSCETLEFEDIPDPQALEAAVRQLCIGRTFLSRCQESLETIACKRIGSLRTVEKLRKATAELRKILDERIEEWEGKLKALGRWEYFSSQRS